MDVHAQPEEILSVQLNLSTSSPLGSPPWGKLSYFRLGLELLDSLQQGLCSLLARVIAWVKDKLWPFWPLPKPYQLRYRRFRFSLP